MDIKEDKNIRIIEFLLDGNYYGINANIVKEIMTYQQVTPVPNAHPSIEGIFMPRDKTITVIDLKNCLQRGTSSDKGFLIVTQLTGVEVAFHIDNVAGIHKIMPEDIKKISFWAQEDGYVESVMKKDSRLIVILDITKIVQDINVEIAI